MDAPMAKGTPVRQRVTVIEGVVTDVRFDADALSFTYEVEYTDAAGESHKRWFTSADIETKEI